MLKIALGIFEEKRNMTKNGDGTISFIAIFYARIKIYKIEICIRK